MASKAKWTKKKDQDGELSFEIDQDTIKKGLDTAFRRVRKNLNVPGFRKGKVPRVVFDQMYGEPALYQDALNAVLPGAYSADRKSVVQVKGVDLGGRRSITKKRLTSRERQ